MGVRSWAKLRENGESVGECVGGRLLAGHGSTGDCDRLVDYSILGSIPKGACSMVEWLHVSSIFCDRLSEETFVTIIRYYFIFRFHQLPQRLQHSHLFTGYLQFS